MGMQNYKRKKGKTGISKIIYNKILLICKSSNVNNYFKMKNPTRKNSGYMVCRYGF